MGGAAFVTGQRPLSPRCFGCWRSLRSCGRRRPVYPPGQGAGNSRRKSATKERRRDISCTAGPDEGGARRAGADTYNPTGQQPRQKKCFYSPSGARPFSAFKGLRPAPWGRPQFFPQQKENQCCSVITASSYKSRGDFSQEMSTMGAPGCGMVNMDSSRMSWACVASAGAASSFVRMYSWLMCCPQALSGSCSLSTVARRPAVASLVGAAPAAA